IALSLVNPGSPAVSAGSITVVNPAPSISGISPTTAPAGPPALSLIVSGSGFVSTSVVHANENAVTTAFLSPTSLQSRIPGTLLQTSGTINIRVVSPVPGGGTSEAATLTIINGVPVLSSITPASMVQNAVNRALTLTGAVFATSSLVLIDGVAIPASYLS